MHDRLRVDGDKKINLRLQSSSCGRDLMLSFSFVLVEKLAHWPREWKHSTVTKLSVRDMLIAKDVWHLWIWRGSLSLSKISKLNIANTHFLNFRVVAFWDIRNLKSANSSLSTLQRSRSVTSAYFSPLTGSQVLITSMDDHVRWVPSTWIY